MADYSILSENELLLLLRQDDKRAFEMLYKLYKVQMASNLLRFLKSSDLAEELLQDLFLKVWEFRAQIDPERSFKSFLYRVSENMVYDFFRRASRDLKFREELKSTYSGLYSHVEETIFQKEDNEKLSEAISLLPPQRRQVFIFCKLEGKSYKEVSELMGISTSTINNQLMLANKFLKGYLNPGSTVAIYAVLLASLAILSRR